MNAYYVYTNYSGVLPFAVVVAGTFSDAAIVFVKNQPGEKIFKIELLMTEGYVYVQEGK